MKKTRLLWFVNIILVLAVMPAMGSGQKEGAEKITLRWLHTPEATGDIENGAFFTALREKYPNVNFQIETMMYSAYPEKFPVMMASGDLPDIFRMKPQAYMPQLVESKLIAPLDEPLKKAYQDSLDPATKEGYQLADKWAVSSSKTSSVPADAKYAVNLQTMFREIMTRIVTGEDPNKVWDEWLAFYKANGGPELEKDVNEYIPVK